MSFSEKVSIGLLVIKDWKAIFILILVFIYVSLANYVVKYKKHPPVPRQVKKAPPAPAPKAEEKAEGDEKEAAGAEGK